SGDDVGGDQIVDGEPVAATQPPEPATQRETTHAGGRVDAEGRGQCRCLSFPIDFGQGCSAFDPRSASVWVNLHLAHRREIDHQPAVAQRLPGDVVAAPAHGDRQVVFQCKAYGQRDVGGAAAADDQPGPPVYHRIPYGPRFVVAGHA